MYVCMYVCIVHIYVNFRWCVLIYLCVYHSVQANILMYVCMHVPFVCMHAYMCVNVHCIWYSRGTEGEGSGTCLNFEYLNKSSLTVTITVMRLNMCVCAHACMHACMHSLLLPWHRTLKAGVPSDITRIYTIHMRAHTHACRPGWAPKVYTCMHTYIDTLIHTYIRNDDTGQDERTDDQGITVYMHTYIHI